MTDPVRETEQRCRRFTLTINPELSGVCSGTVFGDQFDDDDEQPSVTLAECLGAQGEGSKERFQKAAAEIARDWVRSNPEEIFRGITNLMPGDDNWELSDGTSLHTSRISVEGVDFVDGRLVFTFAETTVGDLTPGILNSLVEENKLGGDTWCCGDFGNINMQETEFEQEGSFTEASWREKFGALTTSGGQSFDPTKVELRLTMCDRNASWQ